MSEAGETSGERSEKSKKSKKRDQREVFKLNFDVGRIAQEISAAQGRGAADSRALLDTAGEMLKAAGKREEKLAKQNADLMEILQKLSKGAAKLEIVAAQERIAKIESESMVSVFRELAGTVKVPIEMAVQRFLPQSAGDAADKGARGGRPALLRLLTKVATDPEAQCVREILQEMAGKEDWAEILTYMAGVANGAASEAP